jgi:hypothetical protein
MPSLKTVASALALGVVAVVGFLWSAEHLWQSATPSPIEASRVSKAPAKETARLPAVEPSVVTPARTTAHGDVGPTTTPVVAAWRAFDKSTSEDLRLVVHRASVTGALVDVAAASALRIRCIGNSSPPSYYDEARIKLSDKQRHLLTKFAVQCESEADPSSGKTIRDASGYTGDPTKLRSAAIGSRVSDPDEQDRILRFAKETQSASLLEAVSHAVIDAKSLERMGLPPHADFPDILDKQMAVVMIRVRACEARGDCDGAAMLFPMCSTINACVDDLREYGPRRIYGDRADRAIFPGLIGEKAPSPEAVKARWMQVQAVLQANLF